MLKIEPMAGESIQMTAENAAQFATDRNVPVCFDFNDVHIQVQPGETKTAVIDRWESEMERLRDEYRASPQYAIDQQEAADRLAKDQTTVSQLCAYLSACIKRGDDKVVEWVGQFAGPSDNNKVRFDRTAIIKQLEAAGYVNGDCVGDPDVPTDRKKMARWIIGQAINGLAIGMSPHPILTKFAEEYTRGNIEHPLALGQA